MRRVGLVIVAAAGLVASSAMAADMPVKAPVYKASPPPVSTWTGFYAGGHVGYLWGHTVIEEHELVAALGPTNGVVGGVLAGGNWQVGSLVLGAEADIGWSNAHGSNLGQTDEFFSYELHWTSHARVRIGYAFGATLVYAAAGLATTHAIVHMLEQQQQMVCGGTFTGSSIGAGVEQAFTRQISARVEYLHDDFGHKTYAMPDDTYRVGVTGNTVRGAVVFRFVP
jgi:outer membrane immunogenic protein